MAHNGKEEEHFKSVDEDQNSDEKIETSERKIGEGPQQPICEDRYPQHFGGEEKPGSQLPVFWVEEGKGKGQGHRTNDDEEKQDQRDLLGRVHLKDWG